MNGKIFSILLIGFAAVFGLTLWYVQNYAHYIRLPDSEKTRIDLVALSDTTANNGVASITAVNFRGIEGTTSPLKYRACFETNVETTNLREIYEEYRNPTPLVAPYWFDCFDATEIGNGLNRREATAFLSQAEISDGVDRVVAIFADGRAFAWHQLNDKYGD